MKTVFKFFACMIFAGTAASLQGYVLENRTQYEIDIFAFYNRQYKNCESMYMEPIPFEKAVVTWIAQYDPNDPSNDNHGKEVFPVKDPSHITLQPGQMVEVTMPEDRKCYDICISYMRQNYGWSRSMVKDYCYYVKSDDRIVFKDVTGVELNPRTTCNETSFIQNRTPNEDESDFI